MASKATPHFFKLFSILQTSSVFPLCYAILCVDTSRAGSIAPHAILFSRGLQTEGLMKISIEIASAAKRWSARSKGQNIPPKQALTHGIFPCSTCASRMSAMLLPMTIRSQLPKLSRLRAQMKTDRSRQRHPAISRMRRSCPADRSSLT